MPLRPRSEAKRNALQVLELMERDDIPVYVGADEPLVQPWDGGTALPLLS